VSNVLYIIQDIQNIKTQQSKLGGFVKVRMRNRDGHYEAALGTSVIKINKYKPEDS
jgi:hypothetical protein